MTFCNVTQRAMIYKTLSELNSAYAVIVDCYQRLQETGLMDARHTRLYQGLMQEVQADFNQEFLLVLQAVEMKQWSHFSKLRPHWEKLLRDPEDISIQNAGI